MKRILSILLTALLLLSASAVALADETAVPIRMFYQSTRPTNEFTELTRQFVSDTLGIDMQLTQGSTDWKQQLALYITGGNIPDLMAFMDVNTFQSYAADGVFLDITDMIDDYPNIKKYLGSVGDPDELLGRTSVDGRVFGIPSVTIARSYYVTNIRMDWLENLGLEIPVTLEDYTNVMRAFTFDDPDGNGKDDTYGFSTIGGDSGNPFNYLTAFFGAFGATPRHDDYFLTEDGTIRTNAISDEFKQALEYLRDVYAEGLLDPELFISDYNQIQEKFVRGEMGIYTSWWSGAGNTVSRFGFLDANPEGKISVIQPPVGPDGKSGVIGQDPVESVMAIGYNTQNPEKVLELIDFCCSDYGHQVLMYGIEGQFFELDEQGMPSWVYTLGGQDKLGNAVTDMQVYRFMYNIEVENRARGLDDSPAQNLYRESIGVYTTCATYPNAFMGLTSEELVTYNSELQAYKNEMSIKFILGEADLDTEWDTYVSTFLSIGGEEVRQSLLNAYNELNGTSYTFAD